jgi:hypothetical protein
LEIMPLVTAMNDAGAYQRRMTAGGIRLRGCSRESLRERVRLSWRCSNFRSLNRGRAALRASLSAKQEVAGAIRRVYGRATPRIDSGFRRARTCHDDIAKTRQRDKALYFTIKRIACWRIP